MKIYRRDFLIKMGGSLLLSFFSSKLAFASKSLFEQKSPKLVDFNEPSFDIFYRLCQWLTGREDLDVDIAKKMFPVIQDEPWGKQHISAVYLALEPEIEKLGEDTNIATLFDSNLFKDGEKWFISHLIVTWYLGVYYHEERPEQRITYEGALMNKPLIGLTAIRYIETTPFGEWTEPPIQKEHK